MGITLAEKVIDAALVSGQAKAGNEIRLAAHQTLTQDSTGTMVYLQLEAMKPERIRTELSVAYIDHNTLQEGFENADDHEFIRTVARKYGIVFSKAGNGICHQLHLERFAKPGKVLVGSDSHTPTAGGIGALAIGAGGLDVAVAMAKGSYSLIMPSIFNVRLRGRLPAWVSAKDLILEVLRTLTVKGGTGRIIEYSGEGLASLSVPDRATIANMGAELGATTSIFPSDSITRDFLARQGREGDFVPLSADPDAVYEGVLEIDLGALEPSVSCPHSPDAVKKVRELTRIAVDQVAIGSCTNSSYRDLMRVAKVLKGKTIPPQLSLVVSPGSSAVLEMLIRSGALADMIAAGARILESSCGPCIGMGQAPKSGAVSVRTFNRNFKGRCGTADAVVYLASPETAAATALSGYLTDPRELGPMPEVEEPSRYALPNGYFVFPSRPGEGTPTEVAMGPNIKPFPLGSPLGETLEGKILLKAGNGVTTDDIMPSNAKLLPFRSNVPKLSEFCFGTLVPDFKARAEAAGGGIVVGGENYGQGSSREHAALVPLYLGVRAVVVKSFARIHKSNLMNSGIVPLVFAKPEDYEAVREGETLVVEGIREALDSGLAAARIGARKVALRFEGSEREKAVLKAGGYLNYMKGQD
jgi:aconitate hydratase